MYLITAVTKGLDDCREWCKCSVYVFACTRLSACLCLLLTVYHHVVIFAFVLQLSSLSPVTLLK